MSHRVLGVLFQEAVVLTPAGDVVVVPAELTKGELNAANVDPAVIRHLGRPPRALFDGAVVATCARCSNRGIANPSSTQAKFLAQTELRHGAYPWSGSVPGDYCMSCSFPPR
ncbi:MAG: hypothetical protein AAGE52_16105 [Myxococcota bacterium]